ncbi:hypothetical protein [Lacticaseibacillus sharpeae]|uniref:Uncharacterized protein n=1 Tax=Lacticaseibacillus sharpeae JCM 1186 = DSM 20505 TaxID=1291052 RepID=A0A0R1ZVC1_9LACO|nr:hypothetical protein [Lacticaseibacillus sharpeae]KRM55734.1 hypothetical protein FC18_GL001108 [Lacticaseibacillus sharpeae JCM 1186 = DSM 20505]
MYTNAYIATVSSHLDRLLVYKQVFGQHIASCERILCGKCLATENTQSLANHLLRNLARFVPFASEVKNMPVPEEYAEMHAGILAGLNRYETALNHIFVAMQGTQLDQRLFLTGVSEQERALATIDFQYFDNLRYGDIGA